MYVVTAERSTGKVAVVINGSLRVTVEISLLRGTKGIAPRATGVRYAFYALGIEYIPSLRSSGLLSPLANPFIAARVVSCGGDCARIVTLDKMPTV